jgi:predicted GNAT family acetyltransferase
MKKIKKRFPNNWKSNLYIKKTIYKTGEIEYDLMIRSIDVFFNYKTHLGYLTVLKKNKIYFVKVVHIEKIIRGHGCGMMLYENAIQDLGHLATKYHDASESAQNVWKKLINKYKTKFYFFDGIIQVYLK